MMPLAMERACLLTSRDEQAIEAPPDTTSDRLESSEYCALSASVGEGLQRRRLSRVLKVASAFGLAAAAGIASIVIVMRGRSEGRGDRSVISGAVQLASNEASGAHQAGRLGTAEYTERLAEAMKSTEPDIFEGLDRRFMRPHGSADDDDDGDRVSALEAAVERDNDSDLPEDDLVKVLRLEEPRLPTSSTTTTTPKPKGDKPYLYCWSHMQIGSYEEKLISFQLKRRSSIFACNGYAVISSKKKKIGTIDDNDVYTWYNPAKPVGMGRYGVNGAKTDSFLNTQTFLQAWDTLMHSKHLWPYDFVVKVDPDAVFFPDRLRPRVKDYVGQPVYFSNCPKYAKPQLYGSIEVFSVPAIGAYQDRVEECKRLPWQGWGEDYYMQHCMDMIGVRDIMDNNQVGDDRCLPSACTDWQKVAFHDFKDPKSWEECFEQAISR